MSAYSTLKRGGPLKQRSDKRVRLDHEFAEVREFVMERDGGCQLRIPHHCLAPIDPHHIVPVGRDTTLRMEPTNLVALCRVAHDWVHAHPLEATAVGLLRSAP